MSRIEAYTGGKGIDILVPFFVMSCLQERVLSLGICPFCHKRGLSQLESLQWHTYQCDSCLKVFVREEPLNANLLVR